MPRSNSHLKTVFFFSLLAACNNCPVLSCPAHQCSAGRPEPRGASRAPSFARRAPSSRTPVRPASSTFSTVSLRFEPPPSTKAKINRCGAARGGVQSTRGSQCPQHSCGDGSSRIVREQTLRGSQLESTQQFLCGVLPHGGVGASRTCSAPRVVATSVGDTII